MLRQMVGSVLLAKPKDMLPAAVVCEITLDAATVASEDLGGINVRVALCDLTGCVLAERVELSEQTGGTNVVEQVSRMVCAFATDFERLYSRNVCYCTHTLRERGRRRKTLWQIYADDPMNW